MNIYFYLLVFFFYIEVNAESDTVINYKNVESREKLGNSKDTEISLEKEIENNGKNDIKTLQEEIKKITLLKKLGVGFRKVIISTFCITLGEDDSSH